MSVFKLILSFLLVFPCACVLPGPKYPPTRGEVWPKPRSQVKRNTYYVLESGNETFQVTKPYYNCDILERGINRLLHQNIARRRKIIVKHTNKQTYAFKRTISPRPYFRGTLGTNTEFIIELTRKCEKWPHLNMDEKYKLTVGENIVLTSVSVWGVLRGLETFDQLLYYAEDYSEIRINATSISDYPAYPHRGLLIDTGRHYLQPATIKMIIDAMEANKMNVLHWHVVDDESFPFQSERLPDLSRKGAFHPSMVYTKGAIRNIIGYARLAGIRVIPEFDAPGHVRSWGLAYPDILTECYGEFEEVVALGSLYPINNKTHLILKQLYQEVTEIFRDKYIHLGGDEVDTECWLSNLQINRFKKQYRIKSSSVAYVLHSEFMNAVTRMLPGRSRIIVWQDVFDERVKLPNETVVQVWKKDPVQEMIRILKSGSRVLLSSPWYLDDLSKTWETFYVADPRQMVFNGTKTSGNFSWDPLDIIGGEACMWGGLVDDSNIMGRIWPRASAVAERLWSGVDRQGEAPNATRHARCRLEEHACRMRRRGLPADPPNGPGFCFPLPTN